MQRDSGLAPIDPPRAWFLVLGSFPSRRSLELGQYYGHRRNHFWELMGMLTGMPMPAGYELRLQRLAEAGIAVWDLVASCSREGSLDRDILDELPNPVGDFVAGRPGIAGIALNGGKAAEIFRMRVAPTLGRGPLAIGEIMEWRPPGTRSRSVLVSRMPSTSPVPTRGFKSAADKAPGWLSFYGAVMNRI